MKDPTKAYLSDQTEALKNFDYASASDEEKATVRDLLKARHERDMAQARADLEAAAGPQKTALIYEGDGIIHGLLLTLEPHEGCAWIMGEFKLLPIEKQVALLTQWISVLGNVRANLVEPPDPDPRPAA